MITDQRVKDVRFSFVEARSEVFLICHFVNIPCQKGLVLVEMSFVVAILLAVCLCLLLVLVGDISVTGMTSVMLMIVVERGMSWQ